MQATEPIPLDPDEGPTLWAKPVDVHTFNLIFGTDPEDAVTVEPISVGEIERLYSLVEDLE